MSEAPPTRAEKLAATQLAKLDKLFANRTFDLLEEIHLPRGQVFKTVLGNKGRHGYIIRDRATGEKMIVGASVLKHIARRYLGINLPQRRIRYLGREPQQ